jgi:ring-1,2-phenylacetyl-CoA epoxidase subunit PaaD
MIQVAKDIHIKRKEIAALLHEVADPEIPVVSIVDLGMVVDIQENDDQWNIALAPTYSGCPAIDVIPLLVKIRLEEAGLYDIKVEMQLSPPWSTEWISETARDKLLHYGIAPPNAKSRLEEDEGSPKQCPQCGSSDTIMISRFSSTPCKAAYRCAACDEPFEYFKCY